VRKQYTVQVEVKVFKRGLLLVLLGQLGQLGVLVRRGKSWRQRRATSSQWLQKM
jgi:hypothetical protein